MVKRVAILGFAPSFVEAPFADPSIEIWTLNQHHQDVPRTSRIFSMHAFAVEEIEDGGEHIKNLSAATVPVYMLDKHPKVPTSVRYPREKIAAKYQIPNREKLYITNTISFMLALAIEEGFEEIQTFGVNMAQDTEYGHQRPSCEFWLGLAMGKGIRIVPNQSSDLLNTLFEYGYDVEKQSSFRAKVQERRVHLVRMREDHERQVREHQNAANQFPLRFRDRIIDAPIYGFSVSPEQRRHRA